MAENKKTIDLSEWIKIVYSIYRNTLILNDYIEIVRAEKKFAKYSDYINQEWDIKNAGNDDWKYDTSNEYSVEEFVKYLKGEEINDKDRYNKLATYIKINGTENLFVINAFKSSEISYNPRGYDRTQTKYDTEEKGKEELRLSQKYLKESKDRINEILTPLDYKASKKVLKSTYDFFIGDAKKAEADQIKHDSYTYKVPILQDGLYNKHKIVILNSESYKLKESDKESILKDKENGKSGYLDFIRSKYSENFDDF